MQYYYYMNCLVASIMEQIVLRAAEGAVTKAEVRLLTFGAHITSWKTFIQSNSENGVEHLWMSSLSALDGSAPIRGGIPIAFPQFADTGPLKIHGFAREKIWTVQDRTTLPNIDKITMVLYPDEDIRTSWNFNYAFRLKFEIELSPDSLWVNFIVENMSENVPLPFTGCLHTYFTTPDVRKCQVMGLQGLTYIDKVDGFVQKHQPEDGLFSVPEEVSVFNSDAEYFIDRIYVLPDDSHDTLSFVDNGMERREYLVEKSSSWPNWVVFNPWEAGKRGSKGPDFDDDGYNYMLCLEPTVALEPIVVSPKCYWNGSKKITITTAR